jgi:hypothetical protein
MKNLALGIGMLGLATAVAAPAAADPIKIVMVIHGSTANEFWQPVKKGFEDACAKIQADCQMLFTNTNMSVQEELTNVDAALATNPDALILTIPDNNAFTKVVADARAKGSPRSLSSSLRLIAAVDIQDREAGRSSASCGLARQGRDRCGARFGFADADLQGQAALRLFPPDIPSVGVLGTPLAFQDPSSAPATGDFAGKRGSIEKGYPPFLVAPERLEQRRGKIDAPFLGERDQILDDGRRLFRVVRTIGDDHSAICARLL